MSRVPSLITLTFLLLSVICGVMAQQPALAAMDHQFIFFPETPLVGTPALYDLPYEEVVYPTTDGERIHGWLVPGDQGKPLILFCHGNAGNISHRLDNLRLFNRLLGVSVFIFDYRGYGKSTGKASEEGTYADARGALDWLRQRGWQPARMIYFGRSLGAGVAVQLALEQPPGALVLETPFPSIAAMGWRHNPILYLLLGWALDARYDSFNKLDRIQVPLLMFQGDHDNIVPEKMARGLFERANNPKTFHLIRGAGHNNTYDIGGEAYWEAWREFLDRYFPPPGKQQGEG